MLEDATLVLWAKVSNNKVLVFGNLARNDFIAYLVECQLFLLSNRHFIQEKKMLRKVTLSPPAHTSCKHS